MRIQFELSQEDADELKSLMKDAGISTHKELFNNALTLLYWAVKQVKDDRIVASVDEKNEKYEELQMEIFDNLKKKNQENAEDKEK